MLDGCVEDSCHSPLLPVRRQNACAVSALSQYLIGVLRLTGIRIPQKSETKNSENIIDHVSQAGKCQYFCAMD